MSRPPCQDPSADDRISEPAELERQAWAWLRLLGSGKATQQDADQFRRWIQLSSANRQAYNKVKLTSDVLKPSIGALRHSDANIAALHARKLARPSIPRRQFLGAAAGAAAVAGLAVAYPPLGLWAAPSEWGADYRTVTGEQRTLALADRVQVTLNTRTSIRRQLDGGRTVGFELVTGEAAVELTRGARPFSVVAGVGRSSAQTGEFQVRYLDGKVCVTCIDGEVRVEHPAGVRALQPRQQAIYDARSVSGAASVDPANVTAWRSGTLVFDETRLVDVIEEINRYRFGRVVLMNDAVRNKRVSGSFSIKSLDQALLEMQQVFGLQARALVGGVVILS